MERLLEPYTPPPVLATPMPLRQVTVRDYASFSPFREGSAQDNYLRSGDAKGLAIVVHAADEEATGALDGDDVVACAFGSTSSKEASVYSVFVNKRHPLNDARGGKRWGHYGLSKAQLKDGKTRWYAGTVKLTASNHERHVRGTANPFAVFALQAFVSYAASPSVVQNPYLPCAHLFHTHYDNRVDPSVQLVYSSLGFRKSHAGNYVWYADMHQPVERMFQLFLQKMNHGLDASA